MTLQQVARQGSPLHDAAVIQAVRKKVGYQIQVRADANRNWTYKEAIQFGSLVKDCDLQYIEVYSKKFVNLSFLLYSTAASQGMESISDQILCGCHTFNFDDLTLCGLCLIFLC